MDKVSDSNCLKVIHGGIGRDDDVQDFWDYVYTLNAMKQTLEDNGLIKPFTIKSDKWTKIQCSSGNHIKPIAKEVIERSGELYILKGNIWVNEFDYIMSRNWVKEWKVEKLERDGYDERYPFYYIKLEKNGKYVITGGYGGLIISE